MRIILWIPLIILLSTIVNAEIYREGTDIIFRNDNFNITISPENATYFVTPIEPIKQTFTACNNFGVGGYIFGAFSFNDSLVDADAYLWKNITVEDSRYVNVNKSYNYTCDYELVYNYTIDYDDNNYAYCDNGTQIIWQGGFDKIYDEVNTIEFHVLDTVFEFYDKTYYGRTNINAAFTASNVGSRKVYHNTNGKYLDDGECVQLDLEYVPKYNNGKWDALLYVDPVNDWTCILDNSCFRKLLIDPGWDATNVFNESFVNRAYINNGTTNCTISGGNAYLFQEDDPLDNFNDDSINVSLITYSEAEPTSITSSQSETGGKYILRTDGSSGTGRPAGSYGHASAWFNKSINLINNQKTFMFTNLFGEDPGTPFGYGSGYEPHWYIILTNTTNYQQIYHYTESTGLEWPGEDTDRNFTIYYTATNTSFILENNGVNGSSTSLTLTGNVYVLFNVSMAITSSETYASNYRWNLDEINMSIPDSSDVCFVESINLTPSIQLASFTTEFSDSGDVCLYSYSNDNVTWFKMLDSSEYFFNTRQNSFFWNSTVNASCTISELIFTFNSSYPSPSLTQNGLSEYNQSVAQDGSVNFVLDLIHANNYTVEYTLDDTFNSSQINVTFNYSSIVLTKTTENNTLVTVSVANDTPIAFYSGNLTINSTVDNNVTYFLLNINVTSGSPILTVTPLIWIESATDSETISEIFNLTNSGSNGTSCSITATGGLTPSYSAFNISNGESKSIAVQFSSISAGTYNEYLDFECNGASTSSDPNLVFAISSSPSPPAGGGGGGGEPLPTQDIYNFTITPEFDTKRMRPGSESIFEFKVSNLGEVNFNLEILPKTTEFSKYFSFTGDEKSINFRLPAINQFDPSTKFIRYRISVPEDIEVENFEIILLTKIDGIQQKTTYHLNVTIREGLMPDWWYAFWNYPLYTFESIELLNTDVDYTFATTGEEQRCLDNGDCQLVELKFKVWHLTLSLIALSIIIFGIVRLQKVKK